MQRLLLGIIGVLVAIIAILIPYKAQAVDDYPALAFDFIPNHYASFNSCISQADVVMRSSMPSDGRVLRGGAGVFGGSRSYQGVIICLNDYNVIVSSVAGPDDKEAAKIASRLLRGDNTGWR